MKKIYFTLVAVLLSVNAFALELPKIDLGVYADLRANGFFVYNSKDISGYGIPTQGFELSFGKTSYIGTTMKVGKLSGEFALQNNPNDFIRVLFFNYDMGDYGKIMVGKNFTLAGDYFGQISNDNNYMRNSGTLNNRSELQVRYTIYGASIGLVSKLNDTYVNYSAVPNRRVSNSLSNDDIFPRVELGYEHIFQYAKLRAFGTYGYYQTTAYLRDGSNSSYSMNSASVGIALHMDYNQIIKFDATLFYTLNGALYGGLTKASLLPQYNVVRNTVDDIHSFGGAFAVVANFTDIFAFRAGLGYMSSSSKAFRNSDNNYVLDDELTVFVGCSVEITDYFYLIPEIAYTDSLASQTGTPEGSRFYAGVQLNVKY